MTTEARARFPWGLTVVTVAALALLIWLGVWQVQRLQWKEGLIARAEVAATRPPVSLDVLEAMGGDIEFQTVVLPCDFQNQPYVELQTIHEGEPGVRLIGACRSWLVDLGFVPETVSARPARMPAALPPVSAQARLAPPSSGFAPAPENGRFYGRDNVAMAKALGVMGPVSAHTLYATNAAWPQWEALQPSAPPVAFANNHLGYALTWFGLALALAGIYGVMLRRRMKR